MATKEIQALAQDAEVHPLLYDTRRFTDAEGEEREVEVQRNYLRSGQRAEFKDEIRKLEVVLEDPIARKAITDIGRVTRRLAALRRDLKTQSPVPLTASQRDKIAKLNRLCQAAFTDCMPTDEQMRRKPPGAVDHHRAWDETNKRAVLFWKASQLLLHPESTDIDLCNVERFRPSPATRNLHVDAQLPGVFALSPQAKANYDAIDWASPEVAEKIEQLIAAGTVRINRNVRRGALRTPKNTKTYDCACAACQSSGRIWTGSMAAARLKRHQNEIARERRAQEATPA